MKSRFFSLLLIAFLGLALAGCAGMSLRNTFDTEADLLTGRGEPTQVYENEDGTRTFQYSTQPRGKTTWTYVVDEDGIVVEQYDALAHRNLTRVKRGMSMEEVERLLGEHRSERRFTRLDEVVRDWNVSNEWPGLVATRFNVHFVDGEVDRTSYTRIQPNDGMFGGGFYTHDGFYTGARFGHGPWRYGYRSPFYHSPFWW